MTFRALAAPYPDAATFRSRGAPRPQHLDGQHRVAGRAGDLNRALSVIHAPAGSSRTATSRA